MISLNEKEQFKSELANLLTHDFIPHKAVIWRTAQDKKLFTLLPSVREQPPVNDRTTLYICHQGVCQKPLSEMSEMIEAIHKL